MSLFDGAERRVETHKTGSNTKYNQFGRKIYNVPEKKEAVTEHVTATIIQGPEETKPELSEAERKYRESQLQKTINKNNYVNNLAQLGEVTKVGVLENILTSLVYESLYLDDEFKDFNMTVIEEAVHNFVEDRGGYSYLTDAYNRTKSPLLRSIMNICEESGKEINQRRINEMKDGKNNELAEIRFNVTPDEKDRIDYSKDSIGIQQVADAIKNKVLNVVKDEKKRETEHAELMDEIESQLTEDPTVNNPEQVAEALSKIFIKNTNIEEATLFNTILRTNYKRVLENGYEDLDLMRMNDNEINVNDDNFMNTKLDGFLLDEDVVDNGKLNNDDMRNIFDDFIFKMGEETESTMDDVIESFSSLQPEISKTLNKSIYVKDLKDIRNDLKILQETFNEIIDDVEWIEEGKECKGDCKGKGMSIVNDNDVDAVKDTIPKKDNKKDEKKDDKKEEPKKEETKKNGSAIETTFTPDSLRNKDIVKECITDIFAGYISTIDEKLEAHERANETAKQSVLENVNGERLLIPIVKKSDMQLDGLNLAYKMKHVLESLTNLCNHYEGDENIALIKHAVESNINNTNYVLETYKSIPSTPAYKVCYFQTFKDLLNMVHENVNELAKTYDEIDIKELDYDDVDGDLLIDDDYNSFRILTESIDDNPIYGEAECIDMDFILANTIFEYTLMETMYTIQLESYDHDFIKGLTNDLLNSDGVTEGNVMYKAASRAVHRKIKMDKNRNKIKTLKADKSKENKKEINKLRKENAKHLADIPLDGFRMAKDGVDSMKSKKKK